MLDIQNEYSDEKTKAIDQRIFDLYGLTQEKRDAIGYIDFHNDEDNKSDADDDEKEQFTVPSNSQSSVLQCG